MTKNTDEIVVRSLHTTQGDGLDVFAFFMALMNFKWVAQREG